MEIERFPVVLGECFTYGNMSNDDTLTNSFDIISQQQWKLRRLQHPPLYAPSGVSELQVQGSEGDGNEEEPTQNGQVIPREPLQQDSVRRSLPKKKGLQSPVVVRHTPTQSLLSSACTYEDQVQAPYSDHDKHANSDEITTGGNGLPSLNTSLSHIRKSSSGTPSANAAGNSVMTSLKSRDLDISNPLIVLMPASAHPTEVLANRFTAWRSVIKSIITYLMETASIQDEVVRQQLRLNHALQFPFFISGKHKTTSNEMKSLQSFFMPADSGSIQELPSILNKFHGAIATHASKMSKELTNDVIPRLEDLRRDLLVKIKEIKSLQSDFKNSCFKELQQTKIDMDHYLDVIEESHKGTPKHDPYLAKIVLDKQIRKQLTEENSIHEAFDNLESSGSELENAVVVEIQNSLTKYAHLIGEESRLVFDILLSKLDDGFLTKNPDFEWNNFIRKDPNFITPNLPMRKLKAISYKYQFDPLSYEIRAGCLERRSKFLKSYSRGYYVLTPNFLHEFKTPDRKKDQIPMMSLALSECKVTEHSKRGSSDDKFVLHAKQNGIIHRGHNWVFKADDFESMMAWFQDLKILTSLVDLEEKNRFVHGRLNLASDGRPKPTSTVISPKSGPRRDSTDRSLKHHVSGAKSDYSGTPMQASQSDFFGNLSTPRLDNHTTTISSFPDTSELSTSSNSMYNVHIHSLENLTHKA